ncbi:AraC family transcriptional regulator [Agarivorans sp. QJM3NY_25]|uniref:AraC family transcriptional regulator n=1 Tax=Agarivorans sp. QJM3NY_25 TaxID=3421430 RepID=UPI003D7DA7DC
MASSEKVMLKRSIGLPSVELRQAYQSRACYHRHSHDEFSFGVIDAGEANYQNLRQLHRIQQGQVVTINPGDVHSCNPKQGAWSFRMLFVDSRWVGQLQAEMLAKPATDYHAFGQDYLSCGASYRAISQLFNRIAEEQALLLQEELLIGFFEQQFSAKQGLRSDVERLALPQLARVQQCIQDQLAETVSLSELADVVGLSRYHLVRSFKRVYGLSPHAFQLNQRINQAKALLRTGNSIADTALQLGFADQSHFQRNFKKRLALTPKQYQGFFV